MTDRVIVKIEISREVDRAVEIRAAEMDISKRQFIENALREALGHSR